MEEKRGGRGRRGEEVRVEKNKRKGCRRGIRWLRYGERRREGGREGGD